MSEGLDAIMAHASARGVPSRPITARRLCCCCQRRRGEVYTGLAAWCGGGESSCYWIAERASAVARPRRAPQTDEERRHGAGRANPRR